MTFRDCVSLLFRCSINVWKHSGYFEKQYDYAVIYAEATSLWVLFQASDLMLLRGPMGNVSTAKRLTHPYYKSYISAEIFEHVSTKIIKPGHLCIANEIIRRETTVGLRSNCKIWGQIEIFGYQKIRRWPVIEQSTGVELWVVRNRCIISRKPFEKHPTKESSKKFHRSFPDCP